MYAFLDRQVSELDPGSELLLRVMRAWVLAVAARNCPTQRIIPILSEAGAPPVAGKLHFVMQLLHRNGNQPMKFGQMEKPRITEAEALMLGLWADTTRDRGPNACATLELLVNPAAIGPMLNSMVEVVAHLSTVHLAPAALTLNGRTTS